MQNNKYSIEFDNNADFGSRVLCPVCKYDYTHLADIDDRGCYGECKKCGEPPKKVSLASPISSNYSNLGITMYCETGHRWKLWFGSHKGNTFTMWERLPDDKDVIDQK